MGVSVLRITEWSYYGTDQTTDSAFAYLPLKNTYTGVAVTLITNGNAEEWPGAFSADNNNWHQFSEKDGTIKRIRIIIPRGIVGHLITTNYVIYGWVK